MSYENDVYDDRVLLYVSINVTHEKKHILMR